MPCPTFVKSCQKQETTKGTEKEAINGAISDLPVPCSYSHIYPLSARPHRVHRLSWLPSGWCKSEHCTAGTQSWDRAPGRTASFFSKRRCGPSSPTFNPTLLLLLLSRPQNYQTSLLADQDSHRSTTIQPKNSWRGRTRGREGQGTEPGRGKNRPYPQTSAFHMGELKFAFPVPSLFFHSGGGGSVCAPCVFCARVRVRVCARARDSSKRISLLHEQLGCWSFSASGFHVAKWLQRLPTNN